MKVHLGYTVPDGEPVDVELTHTAVFGITRQSGKTTTIEAIAKRSGLTSLVFRTEPGELPFEEANRVLPFFTEHADYRWVEGLLNAHNRERNRIFRPFLMRVCRGAKTLADVARNIETQREKVKEDSFVGGILFQLHTYLAEVAEYLEVHALSMRLQLREGHLNVMDLTDMPLSVKQLVVSSCMDHVLEHRIPCLIVVPEAWEMIPGDRVSPVRLSAEAIQRRGAKLGIYEVLDSQQLTSLDQDVLRNTGTRLFGRQDHGLERERVAKEVPGGRKLGVADKLSGLQVGEFYLVQGNEVRLIYVQPAWLPDDEARRVAQARSSYIHQRPAHAPTEEEKMGEEERKRIAELERELKESRATIKRMEERQRGGPAPPPVEVLPTPAGRIGVAATGELVPLSSVNDGVEVHIDLDVREAHIVCHAKEEKIQADDTSLEGKVATLIADGFMATPRTVGGVAYEMRERGWGRYDGGSNYTSLAAKLRQFYAWKLLKKDGTKYALADGAEKRIRRA